MSDNVAELTIEHLRLMREEMTLMRKEIADFRTEMRQEMTTGFDDMRRRLTRVEHSILGLKRDETDAATELTEHRHTLDKLELIIRELRDRISTLETRAAH